MKLLVSTVAPYAWVKLDKRGRPVERGQFLEAAFLSTIPRDIASVVGVAPAYATTFHSVVVPTKKRSNMLAAVPFALEDSVSEDIDSLHFTVCDWFPGQAAQVMVIARDTLQHWQRLFADAGVKLDAIVPELALLPIHPDCEATLVRQTADQYLIKTGKYAGFSCDQDALEYWWSDAENRQLKLAVDDQEFAAELLEKGGEQVNHWAIGKDFCSWVEQTPGQLKTAPSLLHDRFEPEHLKPRSGLLNVAGVIVLLALLGLGASNWLEASQLEQQLERNQQAIRSLFDEAFPGEEYLDQPRRQIASLLSISEDNPPDETFQYLLGLSSVAALEHKADVEEINYRDQQLQIGVSGPNFAALEKLTEQLNSQSGLRAALISSGAREKRVTGQIKMELN